MKDSWHTSYITCVHVKQFFDISQTELWQQHLCPILDRYNLSRNTNNKNCSPRLILDSDESVSTNCLWNTDFGTFWQVCENSVERIFDKYFAQVIFVVCVSCATLNIFSKIYYVFLWTLLPFIFLDWPNLDSS